jgi:hypothetical protein
MRRFCQTSAGLLVSIRVRARPGECHTCGTVEHFQHLARELIASEIKYVESLRRGLAVILPCEMTDADANADHSERW